MRNSLQTADLNNTIIEILISTHVLRSVGEQWETHRTIETKCVQSTKKILQAHNRFLWTNPIYLLLTVISKLKK